MPVLTWQRDEGLALHPPRQQPVMQRRPVLALKTGEQRHQLGHGCLFAQVLHTQHLQQDTNTGQVLFGGLRSAGLGSAGLGERSWWYLGRFSWLVVSEPRDGPDPFIRLTVLHDFFIRDHLNRPCESQRAA